MIKSSIYWDDIEKITKANLPWEKLNNSNVLITGVTGMIGSVIADVLMYRNKYFDSNIFVIGLGRDKKKAERRFEDKFEFIECDINHELKNIPCTDFIFHCASNTHPVQYANKPIETILTCIIGSNNIMEYAVKSNSKRIVFLSSVEIYGENKGNIDRFDENYSGYINCNTVRAGYPESKRAGEALCKAYESEYGLDIVIPRLCRIYGPTMAKDDSKVIAQFLRKALNDEDIVLKSDGLQEFSYLYVIDAVLAIFTIFLKGQKGETYNVSDEKSDILLKDLANLIAKKSKRKVIFELPKELEKKGFSVVTKAMLSSLKLKKLGFNALYTLDEGIERTLNILK